jgi:hypothetical protein
MTTRMIAIIIGGSLAVVPVVASADDVYFDSDGTPIEQPAPYSYAWAEPRMASLIGVGFTLGGGVNGFTDSDVRDAVDTDVGGVWAARATIGTHIPIGLDISYTGSSQNLHPLGVDTSAELIGTNVEGALRWNILPHYAVNPYIFAGMGWQRYDVNDADFSLSDAGIDDSEDLVVFPMGAGVSYRDLSGVTLEARGTFRAAGSSELIETNTGQDGDLHSWEASGNVGYEF